MICVSSSKSSCPACGADIQVQINLTEANSTKCESGEVACSPAGTQVSLPRSPDRELIAKLKIIISNEFSARYDLFRYATHLRKVERIKGAILRSLDELDQGDGHNSPTKVPAKKKARSVKSKKAKK